MWKEDTWDEISKHFRLQWVSILQILWRFNSLAPGRFQFDCRWVIFKLILLNGGWGISYKSLGQMPLNFFLMISNVGSGNGLVPSGNKSLPDPMLTQFCRHMASLGHKELSHLTAFRNIKFLYDAKSSTDGSLVTTKQTMDNPIEALNSSPPGQHGRHFPDDIFRCIFMNDTLYILIKISLKFVPNGPIDNIPALV